MINERREKDNTNSPGDLGGGARGGEERGVGESLMPSGAIKGPASTLKNQQRLIAPLHPNSLLNPASFSLFPPRF